jgi:hypothetical protein
MKQKGQAIRNPSSEIHISKKPPCAAITYAQMVRPYSVRNRRFVFNDDEKERFRKIMRAVVT